MKQANVMAVLMIMVVLAGSRAWAAAAWGTDFEAVKKQAAETGRPILANFSGSDWCGWCVRLDKEVFSKDAFAAFAKDNLVLFLADFPAKKEQPAALKEQNIKLAEKYQVAGYPTVLLLDAEGKVIATTGYQPGGDENYVAHIKTLIEKKK